MAKIKICPKAGALSKLLAQRRMTKMDAHQRTSVDRKTLSRIDRGEEVKLETLQKVAKRLGIGQNQLLGDTALSPMLEPGTVMLSKLDAERMAALLKGAARVRWELNAPIRSDETGRFLEQLEETVEQFSRHLNTSDSNSKDSLRWHIGVLKIIEDMDIQLKRLVDDGLALFGTDYLFWDEFAGETNFDGMCEIYYTEYTSCKVVLLSIDPSSAQARHVQVFSGSEPPKFAPNNSKVLVNGRELMTQWEAEIVAEFGPPGPPPAERQ